MARKSGAKRPSDGAEAIDRALAELWTSISSGDVLSAEMQASSLIALPLLTGGTDAEYDLLAADNDAEMTDHCLDLLRHPKRRESLMPAWCA